MEKPCMKLLMLAAISSALPAVLTSMAILFAMLMLDKISATQMCILGLVVVFVAFLPTGLTYFIGQKMSVHELRACLRQYEGTDKPQPQEQQQHSQMRAYAQPAGSQSQMPMLQTSRGFYPGAPQPQGMPSAPQQQQRQQAAPQAKPDETWLQVFAAE